MCEKLGKMLRNVKFLVGIGRTYHSTRVLAAKRDFGVRHRLKMAKDDERNTVEMLEDDPGNFNFVFFRLYI